MYDHLWVDAHLATMTPGGAPYGAIRDGALATRDGRIAWVGPRADLPTDAERTAKALTALDGAWVTPGLVDCHTHLVFAGDRSAEFEERLGGATYEEISRRGGGILSTVRATRGAGQGALTVLATARARRLAAGGVTTVEVKSGYGLDLATEHGQLAAARAIAAPVRVTTTFLALHAVPPGMAADAFTDLAVGEMLPALHDAGLIDAVDAFCEHIAFTPAQCARLFEAAAARGLPVKLHADQLSDGGGAALAARFGALSADHVEYTSDAGVTAMAAAGVVAVLLPGAFLHLRETQVPPIAAFRRAGVRMAVATDCNPGSSPTLSPTAMLHLACTLFRLTPEEALAGMTRHAAQALGLVHKIGTLEVGKSADLAVWDVAGPGELAYWIGGILPRARIYRGIADV